MSHTTPSQPTVPYIPETAPFTEAQRAWLNGFLDGFYSQTTTPSPNGEAAQARPSIAPVTILFGSQTGNAETLAKKTAKTLQKKGIESAVHDMASYDPGKLTDERYLLILTSTYGDGDPPDNAQDLLELLQSDQAPRLDHLKYALMALGDSSYDHFCQCGKAFDERLAQLGAEPLAPRVDSDVDFEGPFQSWLDAVLPALNTAASDSPQASGTDGTAPASAEGRVSTSPEETETPTGHTKDQPFPAPIVKNQNLNGEGSAKATHHVELSLDRSGLNYEVGDAIGVWPSNEPGLVEEWLAATGFNGNETVPVAEDESMSLREALTTRLDITQLTPNALHSYAEAGGHLSLRELVASGKEDELTAFLSDRQWIDLLTEFPVAWDDPASLVGLLRKLQPRLYSIASSPKAYPDEVHLTVRAVRYECRGRLRKGVCSTFLADQEPGNTAKVYIQPNPSFKLPKEDDRPIIMVGPGTGIAPFRAFLQERRIRGATGRNWLFFGDHHATCDFLYADELRQYLEDGTLTALDTAFSRDQADKCYIQHRMLEKAAGLYRWLEEGAVFYVCGDASRMAKDVDAALHQIIAKQGNLSEEATTAYVKRLKKEKRYLRDIY